MRSSIGGLIVLLALAGCAVEHGNQPPERPPSARSAAPHALPSDSARGAMHQVFARQQETVAPGVERLTLSAVVRMDAGRAAAQATLEAIAAAARLADSTVAAIKVLGFLPPPRGHGEEGGSLHLVPLAYLEWVPPGGWDSLTTRSARLPHRTNVMFVQDLPTHPRLPGAR